VNFQDEFGLSASEKNKSIVISHTEKKGLDRLSSEIKDIFGGDVSAGLGAGVTAQIFDIVNVTATINAGSLVTTTDKNGVKSNDKVEFEVGVSILNIASAGINVSKEKPATTAPQFIDHVKNAWEGTTSVTPKASIKSITADNDTARLQIGGQVGAGFNVWVDIPEVVDLIRYVSGGTK